MKKITAVFVCCMLLSSCLTPGVFASEEQHMTVEEISPRYEIISVITASLNISESGRADCGASVRVPSGYKVELLAEL